MAANSHKPSDKEASASALQNSKPPKPENGCTRTFNETVTEVAELIIAPVVTPGETKTTCIGNPRFLDRLPSIKEKCSFIVAQDLCAQFDVTFDAVPSTGQTGVICGRPGMGECRTHGGCTQPISFYRENMGVTLALIAKAGGELILGKEGHGLSLIVTPANAEAVLSFRTTSPPAPVTQPLAQQYQLLYAQLLTAQLNGLNGAKCSFAEEAIEAAHTFLAESPEEGSSKAAEIQSPLSLYNEGFAPGCPKDCD
ncbi:hypothetical protein [Bacillus xiapuensis]|uniref:hypothetical protein n=1 Tax=Bacillus xiapuensis TaxID=2014075 RepID=UPI000C230203|nr:hypothetical protein [Bacillus xiapuensis]